MAKPRPLGAYVDPADLSVYADRGILNLEQIGFLNVSGTTHTLHTPGGSDGQIQYNDGGGFGGSTTEFDDATDQTLFASGTASEPSISFKDSDTTGFYLDAFGLNLHIVADGSEHFDMGGGSTRLLANIDAQGRDIIDIDGLSADIGTFTSGLTVSGVSVDIAGITTDHGALGGLGDDDHPQYGQLADAESAAGIWDFSSGLTVSGVPVDTEGGGVVDHGALTGLGDDDHPQYLLEDGSRDMSGSLGMANNSINAVDVLNVDEILAVTGTFTTGLSTALLLADNIIAVTGTFTEGLTIGTGSVDITSAGITIGGAAVTTAADPAGSAIESSPVFVPFPGSGIDGTGDGSEEVTWIYDYDVDVNQATAKTTAGSLTYSLKLNGVIVEGLDNQTANTSQAVDVATSAFAYTAGDEITLAISGATNAQGLRFGLKSTRT